MGPTALRPRTPAVQAARMARTQEVVARHAPDRRGEAQRGEEAAGLTNSVWQDRELTCHRPLLRGRTLRDTLHRDRAVLANDELDGQWPADAHIEVARDGECLDIAREVFELIHLGEGALVPAHEHNIITTTRQASITPSQTAAKA